MTVMVLPTYLSELYNDTEKQDKQLGSNFSKDKTSFSLVEKFSPWSRLLDSTTLVLV